MEGGGSAWHDMNHRLDNGQCAVLQAKLDVSDGIDKGSCACFLFGKNGCAKDKRQGRESLFTGAGRRDDDTSMVLSTAVTSPDAEEHDFKMTPRFPASGSKPTGTPVPSRPTLLCLGQKVPNNKKKKAA